MYINILEEFGTSAAIKTEANNEIDNFNESLQAANNAKKGAQSDKKKINQLYAKASQAASDIDALNLWAA